MGLLLSDFDFEFPPELIAQKPAPRGRSRLLLAPRANNQNFREGTFEEFPGLFKPGDVLVLNNTRVRCARLLGQTPHGGRVEVLCLNPLDSYTNMDANRCIWEVLARPAKKFRPGSRFQFEGGLTGEVHLQKGDTLGMVFFCSQKELFRHMEKFGHVPLPPYIRREDEPSDRADYQSVFAEKAGSAAAPTASLHFSPHLLDRIREAGVQVAKVTLHVGLGTFKPVTSFAIDDHVMHPEWMSIGPETIEQIRRAKTEGKRIWAVGTTVARVLESAAQKGYQPYEGTTSIFIVPGYSWKWVDGLMTNFHWPKSTLFMMVCSLLGVERARAAYQYAIQRKMRLFSYGDAMLIY